MPVISDPDVLNKIRSGTWNFDNPLPDLSATAQSIAMNPRSTDDWIDSFFKRYQDGDISAGEKLFEYFATKDKEDFNRQYLSEREDTAYQRLVADLKKAGISPYIISGANPFAGASSFSSVSGSQMTSSDNARKTQEGNTKDRNAEVLMKILGTIGTIIGALILAA